MSKRAGNTATIPPSALPKTPAVAPRRSEYNAGKDKSGRNGSLRVNGANKNQTRIPPTRKTKAENNGIWCIGKRNGAIERRLCARDELLGNAHKYLGTISPMMNEHRKRNNIHATGKEDRTEIPRLPSLWWSQYRH